MPPAMALPTAMKSGHCRLPTAMARRQWNSQNGPKFWAKSDKYVKKKSSKFIFAYLLCKSIMYVVVKDISLDNNK